MIVYYWIIIRYLDLTAFIVYYFFRVENWENCCKLSVFVSLLTQAKLHKAAMMNISLVGEKEGEEQKTTTNDATITSPRHFYFGVRVGFKELRERNIADFVSDWDRICVWNSVPPYQMSSRGCFFFTFLCLFAVWIVNFHVHSDYLSFLFHITCSVLTWVSRYFLNTSVISCVVFIASSFTLSEYFEC